MIFVAILGICCAGLGLACIVARIGCRHAAELRRTWGFESFRNRSAAQLARWARTKGQQQ